jgi:hypothetical protein
LYLYYKKGRVGDRLHNSERLDEMDSHRSAVKEFAKLFENLTGNAFEPWEREKKFHKKPMKFFPIDMVWMVIPRKSPPNILCASSWLGIKRQYILT